MLVRYSFGSVLATFPSGKIERVQIIVAPLFELNVIYCTLTLVGPQSRVGDKLLIIRVFCPHIIYMGVRF